MIWKYLPIVLCVFVCNYIGSCVRFSIENPIKWKWQKAIQANSILVSYSLYLWWKYFVLFIKAIIDIWQISSNKTETNINNQFNTIFDFGHTVWLSTLLIKGEIDDFSIFDQKNIILKKKFFQICFYLLRCSNKSQI